MIESSLLDKVKTMAAQTSGNDEIVTLAKAILDIEQHLASLHQKDTETQREVDQLRKRR